MSVFHISLSKNSPTQRGALFVKVFSLLLVILKLAILIDKDLEQKPKTRHICMPFRKNPWVSKYSVLFLYFMAVSILLYSFPPSLHATAVFFSNKNGGLQGMTFHSPTGRNNQKGQHTNTDLLLFSPFAC